MDVAISRPGDRHDRAWLQPPRRRAARRSRSARREKALNLSDVRPREFPWTLKGDIVFLNAASTGPLPERCITAVEEWTRLRATPNKLPDEKLFGTLAHTRDLIARMIGASAAEIALAANTSYGMNLAARALPLKPKDVVLTPDLEFPANIYPWWAAAQERGLEYRRIPLENGVLNDESLLRAMDDKRVKCVSVSWIDSANGNRVDLERIGNACRQRGIYFVVDAIQGVGVVPIDVKRANIDILACGAQKWLLSPWGSGFAYVREALARELTPPVVSWMAPKGTDDFRRLRDYDMTWRDDARRFEFITLPFQDFAGMNASLELFFEIGLDRIYAHVTALAEEIMQWAQSNDVPTLTPTAPARRGGVICIKPTNAEKVSERLKSKGVVHSYREGGIRLSPHIYNTIEEVRSALSLVS